MAGVLIACGGSSESGDDDDGGAGTGGSAVAGGSGSSGRSAGSPGGGSGGKGNGASGAGTSGAGTSGAGTAGTGGSESGAGGEAGDSAGGTSGASGAGGVPLGGSSGSGTGGNAGSAGGPPAYLCSTTYDGPMGGPREDGPELLMQTCTSITDETVMARYEAVVRDGSDAQMPVTLYSENTGQLVRLGEPCASSPEEARERGLELGIGEPIGDYATEWFYESAFCDGSTRTLYRELRCDYFDGTELANSNADEVAFLGSLLYWHEFYNLKGSAMFGYAVNSADSGDFVQMCSMRVTFGDFGLCDEIRLVSTMGYLEANGEVSFDEPEVVRTLEGQCH